MKFPKQINIFSTNYKITYVDQLEQVNPDGDKLCLGNLDPILKEIRIYKNDKTDMWKTLFHEMLHALTIEMQILEIIESESHERIIDNLAVGFVDIMIRNKFFDIK